MEIDESTAKTTQKRKRVDTEGHDYQGPKRQKIPLDKKLRQDVLLSIMFAHLRILKHLPGALPNDIGVSEQITAALLNAHNCERQKANKVGRLSEKVKDVDFSYYSSTQKKSIVVNIKKTLISAILVRSCLTYKLKYDKGASWIGIASPMWAFIAGYKARRQELRIGTSDLPVVKATVGGSVVTNAIPISEYGLNQAHGVLLEGITYPPTLKAMMAQSLGPMTSLIYLTRTNDTNYGHKWEAAANRDLMNLPDIKDVIAILKATPASQSKQLMRLIADILLITGSRSANRIFLPCCCLIHCLLTPENIKQITDLAEPAEDEEGYGTFTMILGLNWKDELSFSGYYAFEMYQNIASKEWIMACPTSCTREHAQQVFFHAVFGTYKEDLGILRWMVNGAPKFYNRKELSPAFGKQEKYLGFTPYTLRRWAKMASAQQTDFLGTSVSQVVAQNAFSGQRWRNWGDEFMKHLDTEALAGGFVQQRNLAGITGQYVGHLTALRKKLENRGRKAIVGTVTWNTFVKAGTEYVAEEEIPVESGEFFINNRD